MIHTKSVYPAEIIDSSKDLQQILTTIKQMKNSNGEVNIAIIPKYYPRELQGEKNSTLERRNMVDMNLTH